MSVQFGPVKYDVLLWKKEHQCNDDDNSLEDIFDRVKFVFDVVRTELRYYIQ